MRKLFFFAISLLALQVDAIESQSFSLNQSVIDSFDHTASAEEWRPECRKRHHSDSHKCHHKKSRRRGPTGPTGPTGLIGSTGPTGSTGPVSSATVASAGIYVFTTAQSVEGETGVLMDNIPVTVKSAFGGCIFDSGFIGVSPCMGFTKSTLALQRIISASFV